MAHDEDDSQGAPGDRSSSYAAVIGDVVRSRQAGTDLFDRLHAALAHANDRLEGVQPFQITIGDEFQGVYGRLGQALNATLLVRLLLHGVAEVRFGLGWGSFTRWSAERAPYAQDGPAWWAAREALQAVAQQERGTGSPAEWRTAVRFEPGTADSDDEPAGQDASSAGDPGIDGPRSSPMPLDTAVEGLVLLRDQVLSRLDHRDVRLVLAVLDGATVTQAASRVGISQQAASRRLRANGGYALVRGWRLLGEVG